MTHEEMLQILWKNPTLISTAMQWKSVWVRGKEYRYNPMSAERADLVLQNQYSASEVLPDTICAVVELKSDKADHEVQGQLTKAVRVLSCIGEQTRHWSRTTGIAIAPAFTTSAIELLKSSNYTVLEWINRSSGVVLRQL